jgi:hypothetical protein
MKQKWPNNWVNPSPVFIQSEDAYYQGEGLLWYGKKDGPTEEDYAELEAAADGKSYSIDDLTLIGRYHPEWTTACDEKVNSPHDERAGGIGSEVYEMQNISRGASLADKKIWITGEDGSLTKMIPPNSGLYWTDDEQINRVGARPGSVADKYIGDEELYFDGMWKVAQ